MADEKKIEENIEETEDETKEAVAESPDTSTVPEESLVSEGADPWADWTDVFPELAKEETTEKALTKEDVVRIVREQIKLWLKGVEEGKYPLPKAFQVAKYPYPEKYPHPAKYPYPEKYPYPPKYPYPEKELEELKQKLEEVEKELGSVKKDVEVIRDQPLETIEKSMRDKKYEFPFTEKSDGTIIITK